MGHRGLWADGWKITTYHQPGEPFDDDEWGSAEQSLTGRGLLGADGRITIAGLEPLERAEALTDELAQQPWSIAGPDAAARFAELATPLASAARTVLPDVNPIGLPR